MFHKIIMARLDKFMNNNAYNEFANKILSHYQYGFFFKSYEFSLIASILGFAISTTLTVHQQTSW